MNSVLRQLKQWRLLERVVRLTWGGGRWFAITAAVLGLACLTDWAIDRYSGSQTWRDILRSSWVFTTVDPLSVGETPFWFRLLMTAVQLALAAGLAFYFLARPWMQTPVVDELAGEAEKAHPAFDHRLVTALQLNRPTAQTHGMSKTLIAAVTREAGEIASRYNLLKLIDYRRLVWAALVVVPIAAIWLTFMVANPALAGILVKRQALMDVEIPRRTHLKNITQDVWPTGAEVIVRFEVNGDSNPTQVGVLRVVPEGQPEEFYELSYEAWCKLTDQTIADLGKQDVPEKVLAKLKPLKDKELPRVNCAREIAKLLSVDETKQFQDIILERSATETAHFATKLPSSTRDFSFQARLGDGRTKEAGHVRFEPPPQLAPDDPTNPPLNAVLVLPTYLGFAPDGNPYTRQNDSSRRGEIVDALPRSQVLVSARFNKPISHARLILIERAEGGVRERDLTELEPFEIAEDRKSADWGFSTTPKLIGYRLELVDDRTFTNPVPIRRNIRMWEDRPPFVEFMKESNRNPDPDNVEGKGPPSDYIWDMALWPQGRVMVIYRTRSDLGIREANIRYRVIPKGVQMDLYPDWYKNIHHPRDDPGFRVFFRQELIRAPDPVKAKLGEFIPDLGLFRYSLRGVPDKDQDRIDTGFYPLPSGNPFSEPGELYAGGRRNFEVSDLKKMMPDGSFAKLDIGDTVELYVEVFDKLELFKLTDQTIDALRSAKVSETALKKLSPLKNKEWSRRELEGLYSLTDRAFSTLQNAKVPETVLKKLSPLKDSELSSLNFVREIGKVLTEDEMKQFQSLIVKHARLQMGEIEKVLNVDETKQYQDLILKLADKLSGPGGKSSTNRVAGYTREAKRKIVMTEADVGLALLQRDEEKQKRTDKLRELADDQIAVFKEKKK